ncbi:multifunctional beta-oxidation protein [Phaffia rhodozyma]|uniref:Multifunctional beta-oxidation protein n=1 Tax=Phaffia rhodozyma TaxID=264483 RepID=A0A0F7SGF1_PHARH|nr:multifunctional beta-oxidation protein [Phaffia rhodozyma]
MPNINYQDQVVIVTGAGTGIGKVYALYFASLGAKVVVNDVSRESAEQVCNEIIKAGGKAAPSVHSVTDGHLIVEDAKKAFGGRIDVLLNNAGIIRDKSFKKMTDQEWDLVMLVHLKGAFVMSKAVWPIMRGQKYGRILNTTSAAGLYGNMGQANYSAAKMGLVSFTKTLAREGAKYGIAVNVIAPMAATQMLATVMPPDMLKALNPEFIAPLVGVLCSKDNGSPPVSGRIFEVGAGFVAEVRWEESQGVIFRTDDTFTPSAVKHRFADIRNFDKAEHPESMTDRDMIATLQKASSLPPNAQSDPKVEFYNKVVVITGAGAGLGRAYALMFAKLGAGVVVNDVSEKGAKSVCDEIIQAGGKAVPAVASAEDGDAIIKTALSAPWNTNKRVDVLIANAGILRDKSFLAMSESDWDQVIAVHLKGTFKCCKAVWDLMQAQKGGRIVTTCSGVGIFGNFGQANYSTAKAAILGFTRTLAIEGAKYNILANCIAPSAGTAMTETIWTKEMVDAFKPDFVAPLVGYLASDDCETTGDLFEVSGGWASQVRWERSGGYGFPNDRPLTADQIVSQWKKITDFNDGRSTHPSSTQEGFQQVMENFGNKGSASAGDDDEDPEIVKEAKSRTVDPDEYSYSERDVIIYNMGIGATEKDLKWVYEQDGDFAALPTFGVIPGFNAGSTLGFDWLPNFNPAKLLHGEQYLKIHGKIPTSATLVCQPRLIEVLDKGKSASVTSGVDVVDKATGKKVFETQGTVVLRGVGNFNGRKKGSDRGAASAANKPPSRKPDAVVEEKVLERQAAWYRMSGDLNPLHLDPSFSSIGGFEKPILHGLCSMGIAGKHVLQNFGEYDDIKVRFAGVVYPGETLVTEMWREGPKVIFTTKVKERNTPALAAAAVTLKAGAKAKL